MEDNTNNVNRRNFMRFGAVAGVMAATLAMKSAYAQDTTDDVPFTKDDFLIALQPDRKTIDIISEFTRALDRDSRIELNNKLSNSLVIEGDFPKIAIDTVSSHEKLSIAFQNEVSLKWPKYSNVSPDRILNGPWWILIIVIVIIVIIVIENLGREE